MIGLKVLGTRELIVREVNLQENREINSLLGSQASLSKG
jgi:hypothetical protein